MRQRALHLQAEVYQLEKYTRQALMNLGILDKVDDASTITTEQVSEALGGAEISEQANVSKGADRRYRGCMRSWNNLLF